jgi:hypothetical protein
MLLANAMSVQCEKLDLRAAALNAGVVVMMTMLTPYEHDGYSLKMHCPLELAELLDMRKHLA